jgi:acetyl esterase/lipase
MVDKTLKQLEGESDLLNKIDWEGGFYEAFLGYGLDPNDYELSPLLAKKLQKLLPALRDLNQQVLEIEDELTESNEQLAQDIMDEGDA